MGKSTKDKPKEADEEVSVVNEAGEPVLNEDGTVWVKYKGKSTSRHFTKADWSSLGIEDQGKADFDFSNNWVVALSQDAAAYLYANDPDFRPAVDDDFSTPDYARAGSAPVAAKLRGPTEPGTVTEGVNVESKVRSMGGTPSGGPSGSSTAGGTAGRGSSTAGAT